MDHSNSTMIRIPQFSLPSLHDPEHATTKIARAVTLDLNDPQLLVDRVQTTASSCSALRRSESRSGERGSFTKTLSQRYNISNDEAYDLLKENHQSKVRSMLGNAPVEHSLPAVRLQWPLVSIASISRTLRQSLRLILRSTKQNLTNRTLEPSIDQV